MMRGAVMVASLLLVSCAPEANRPAATPQETAKLAALPPPYDLADLSNGGRLAGRCRACHTTAMGGRDMTGPNLHGVFDRPAGVRPGYRYSPALQGAGFTWDAKHLDRWLADPRGYLPGTKMSFPGVTDETDRRDLIAFLMLETAPKSP